MIIGYVVRQDPRRNVFAVKKNYAGRKWGNLVEAQIFKSEKGARDRINQLARRPGLLANHQVVPIDVEI